MSALTTSEVRNKQIKIYRVLKNLELLPKVSLYLTEQPGVEDTLPDYDNLNLCHPQEYFPNFHLKWCYGKNHYRVYIHVASSTETKRNVGYCICCVGNGLAAIGFAALYSFIHKHRANNKEVA